MHFDFKKLAQLRGLIPRWNVTRKPALLAYRTNNSDVALVFVHGFGGDVQKTWGDFPPLVCAHEKSKEWDVFSLGYASSLRIDVPGVWAADPELKALAKALSTAISLPPLARYKAIAIAAHSMGGLVLQRAMLDDPALRGRIAYAFFFGTPSGGLSKAGLVRRLKRQFRDMAAESPFINSLRQDWAKTYDDKYPFGLHVVAGDRDEFVPSSSSLDPFSDSVQSVISGNHLEIVKPTTHDHLGVVLVVEALAGKHHARGVVDGARLAVERRQFQQAVDVLLPRVADLDDAALVSLALALDGLDRGEEALRILEQRYRTGITSIDAVGVLGGRLKRRWLTERSAADLHRSRELYSHGLTFAERDGNHEQAYYHAINVAFLDLMSSNPETTLPAHVIEMAKRAQRHCRSAPENHWRVATEAEAELICGDLKYALELYSRAISMTQSPRNIDSMYSQAIQVATRTHGQDGTKHIEETFGVSA